mmetsp:Transcript_19892/g.32224  ORF Transcript_19892/g.32224 Transcript_19892/m.32224 type:complete len:357 (+) Transcript_19892:175-1245(+)|eukprot:CAMPEP_0196183040 /NCGR_PEP_ID=MMETSP0911-20130528/30831_1 /TAXON_ID=49265 /ORGANISM="Thalassiosira rotula, Strain GSO102" /LENGTH=356 /DNA_ID=CAMNT_0041452871 /DNA_START=167 /DNA_END=1237 /DNA_ORIENTATION=+
MKSQILSAAFAFSQLYLLSSPSTTNAKRLRGEDQSRSSNDNGRNKEERIIGGSEAPEDRHSYAVTLKDKSGIFCGGSLIAKDVILTAAHCQGAPFDVVVGRHNRKDKDGEVIPIKKQFPHPNYKESNTDNDFMLVFLKRAANTNAKNVKLVKLNKQNSIPKTGSRVTVMGWGDTDIRDQVSDLSDALMKVQVNVISNNACQSSSGKIDGQNESYKGQITSNMLCAKANRKDSCQGDSGGPLVILKNGGNDVQVGVVSWGIGCASKDFPGVYARVSRAYDWIEQEVCQGSQYASQGTGFDCSGYKYKPNGNSAPAPSPSKPSPTSNGNGGGSNNNNDDFDDDWWSSLWDDDCGKWWC